MDDAALEKSVLFSGIPAKELREALEAVPHHIRSYDRAEIVFHQMEDANRIGILLEGSVQAQKPFPNGSQVNVSARRPGEIIGAAAAFSKGQKYPCDIAALETSTILMFRREDVLLLLQRRLQNSTE